MSPSSASYWLLDLPLITTRGIPLSINGDGWQEGDHRWLSPCWGPVTPASLPASQNIWGTQQDDGGEAVDQGGVISQGFGSIPSFYLAFFPAESQASFPSILKAAALEMLFSGIVPVT